jgi:hypothetical protein
VGLTEVTRGKALQRARTCYDHLAGQLGVALADAFERDRVLLPTASGWDLTSAGERKLAHLGLDAAALNESRRPFLRPCLDWTERRPHLAGMLGQALAGRLFDLDWVRRSSQSRALVITPAGERQLLAEFAIKLWRSWGLAPASGRRGLGGRTGSPALSPRFSCRVTGVAGRQVP